jgi:hypothetical protein
MDVVGSRWTLRCVSSLNSGRSERMRPVFFDGGGDGNARGGRPFSESSFTTRGGVPCVSWQF